MSRTTTVRTPSPLDLLVEQKEEKCRRFSNKSIKAYLHQIKKFIVRHCFDSALPLNRAGKELFDETKLTVVSPETFFALFQDTVEEYLGLMSVVNLCVYATGAEYWPSGRDTKGFIEETKKRLKPCDWRTPAPYREDDGVYEFLPTARAYICVYYEGRRDLSDLNYYIQVVARALILQIDELGFALYEFERKMADDLYEYI